MSRTRHRVIYALLVLALASFAALPAAFADHGEGHNGETMELSKSELIEDGEVVTVMLSSYLPGKTATIVTCFNYPAVGPSDCELSNYGMHTVTIADDGTGSYDYPVAVVPGRCDAENSCFVVAGDGFGPNANYSAVVITFAAVAEAEPEPEPEPEPTVTEPEPEPEPTVTEPPTTVAEPEPTVTEPPTTSTAAPQPETAAAPANDSGNSDPDGGSAGTIVLIVVIVLVVAGAGTFIYVRSKARNAT